MRKATFITLGFILAFLIGLTQNAFALEEVYNCRDIDSADYWKLMNNVSTSDAICFSITSSNVTLDLDGYSIIHNRASGALTAINIGTANLQNITVKNGKIYAGTDIASTSYAIYWRKHDGGTQNNFAFENLKIYKISGKYLTYGMYLKAEPWITDAGDYNHDNWTIKNVDLSNAFANTTLYMIGISNAYFYQYNKIRYIRIENSDFRNSVNYDIHIASSDVQHLTSCGLKFNESKVYNIGYNVSLSKDACPFVPLPSLNYTWSKQTTCKSINAPLGIWTGCAPPPITIPSDCYVLEDSPFGYIRGQSIIYPIASCSGNEVDVILDRTIGNFTTNSTSDSCYIPIPVITYNHDFLPNDVVTGYFKMWCSTECTCWQNYYINVTLYAECIRELKQTQVPIEGINQTVYCQPSTSWCKDSQIRAYLDYDCITHSEKCVYGCKDGECLSAEEGEAIIPITGLPAWASFFLSPMAIVTYIGLGISGYIEYKTKSSGKVFIGILMVWFLIFTFFGIYPNWFLIIFVIMGIGIILWKTGVF